jgi:hypothetical protein
MMMKVALATEISDHPFYKIFGGIPTRSAYFTHASVTHYSNPSFVQICRQSVGKRINCCLNTQIKDRLKAWANPVKANARRSQKRLFRSSRRSVKT